ncbi:hypothetical protein Pcinc_003484 [Petrolisthes cinctipes]|uniref:Reverse transcriptase Ty1/copia-type domain-containing protein n=1 Tax=Petrolisthes cinctipes TaxID=88211 RepID=A0AAE1GHQ3_PETCI|nr:hypothetical protein Pcinc_003484 [Petrolisthes cinctipes]
MSSRTSKGYRPSTRLIFDGDEAKYELWEVKFKGYLRVHKLHWVVTDANPDAEKNAQVFAELVQVLDDKSINLIIRDAEDDGKKALAILRSHYVGTSKPRIISLYHELCSLRMDTGVETATDYMIRAETAATSLKTAGETISDSLLIAMMLIGLPPSYKTFCTVITQKEKIMTFAEFKVAFRSFEESEKCQATLSNGDSVMKFSSRVKGKIICYSCGKEGRRSFQCRSRDKTLKANRWCDYCKSNTHDTDFCKNKNAVKSVNKVEKDFHEHDDDAHNFVFKTNEQSFDPIKGKTILVDCGATTHIVTDKSKFIRFNDKFEPENHVIELADGSRTNGAVQGKGDAMVEIYTVKNSHDSGEKFKARYVAKGYSQVQGIDYQENFSRTTKLTSIRMLMQVAAQNGMTVNQMEVKTAYLNADIDCEIFLEQPQGFVETNEKGEAFVCKLKK